MSILPAAAPADPVVIALPSPADKNLAPAEAASPANVVAAPPATPPVVPQAAPAEVPVKVADKASGVVVRVGQHETYDRIVFDWPSPVPFKVTREGDRATIRFESAGSVQLAPTTHLTRGRNFTSATDANGHLSVSFDIDGKSTLKDFFSGASTAIDITGPSLAAAATPAPVAPKVESKPPAPLPTPVSPPVLPKAAPAVTVGTAASVPVGTAASLPLGTAATAVGTSVQSSVPVGTAMISPPAFGPSPPVSVGTSAAAATAQPILMTTTQKSGADKAAIAIGAEPVLVASLDPRTPLRAAIWARGGYGYIVFDRKLTIPVETLTAGLPQPLVPLLALDMPKASGFRFHIPDNTELHATRDGSVWKIYVSKQQPDVPVSATLVAQPDFALGARYLLPLPDAPDPIKFTDPVVGDDLIVIPLNQTQAFSVMRRMADFQIWSAAQGLVIKPLQDKVLVRSVSDGIEITSDAGLHLSPASETGASQQSAQKARSAAAGKSLFDFATWRGKSDESFTQTRQRLQQTIVDVPDRERNRARLELARFYFARGYGAEAVALINYLEKEVPDLAVHSDFLALSGAAKVLADHPEEGLSDLAAANLPDQPEIKLWQAVGNAQLRNWTDAEDEFASAETLMAGYPEPFFSRFFILAIESAIAVGNNREAADWLDVVQTAPHSTEFDPAIDYLHGVLHAKSGRAQAAAAAWKSVVESTDRLYKVRAELALIDLGVANGSLTPAQAADRLEALRFGWRGDDLEVDILHRLGDFYIQAKNVKSGLSILSQAVQLYPHSPLVPKIQEEMSQTFRDVFLGELGKNLLPLDALTLYQQYRDTLMPTGADGIAVTRNLAERLAAIDLMGQAGDLLEDICKNKLQGAEKGRVAARLAAIRLLDHKPQAALDALDLSAGDFLPAGLQRERVLLRAKALAELHREDEALAILKDDDRFPAKVLRADINMKAQHWAEAAKALLDLVGPPPHPGDTFREDQADWLVRSAIALAMSGDQVGLDRLAVDYGAAMAGTTQNNTFRVIVQPEKPGQMRDITAAQSRISDVDMFQGFLDSYRKPEGSDSGQGAGQGGKAP